MRKLFWALLVLVVGFCAYWIGTAWVMTKATTAWLDDRRGEGWAADADVATTGFPLRFVTRLTDLRVVDPGTDAGAALPHLDIAVPAFTPNRVLVSLPPAFDLLAPGASAKITADTLTADMRLSATPALALRSTGITIADLTATGPDGWEMALANGTLRVQAQGGQPATYDIAFDGQDFEPGRALKAIIDRDNVLPDRFQAAAFDAVVTFDRPWDRFALERARPQPTRIDVTLASAQWGQLELKLAGAFDVGPGGVPEGNITVKAVNWRDMIALGVANGAIPADVAQTAEGLLSGLARASGPANTLDVPLTLSGGMVRFGFIPLGPAPRFYLR